MSNLKLEIRGKVSRAFARKTQSTIGALPLYARTALEHESFQFVAGDKLPKLHPGLARNGQFSGFNAPTLKTIFVAKHRYVPMDQRWENSKSIKSSIFHEVGHFVDLFLKGDGNYYGRWGSDDPSFQAAFEQDVSYLKKTDFAVLVSNLPKSRFLDDNKRLFQELFIQSPQARREVYANVWSHIHDPKLTSWPGFTNCFPNCSAIVREHIEDLRQQNMHGAVAQQPK